MNHVALRRTSVQVREARASLSNLNQICEAGEVS
jgi:hypothetical protein